MLDSRQHSRSGWKRRSAFTLVEVTLSLGLLSVVIILGAMVSGAGQNAFVSTSSNTQLDTRVKMALDRVAVEIEMASSDTLDPQLTGFVSDTNRISLQQVVDIVNGAPVLGDVITISWEKQPGEPTDGVDNDGDGLIDEGQLVLLRDAGGANPIAVTLCKDVRQFLEGEFEGGGDENGNGLTDESGFVVERDGDLLTIQLTIEGARANGETTVRTSSTSVVLNN